MYTLTSDRPHKDTSLRSQPGQHSPASAGASSAEKMVLATTPMALRSDLPTYLPGWDGAKSANRLKFSAW